jgi:hypothetical protein
MGSKGGAAGTFRSLQSSHIGVTCLKDRKIKTILHKIHIFINFFWKLFASSENL